MNSSQAAPSATSAPSLPVPMIPRLPPVDNTLGAILIGTFLSIFFQGIISHQAYHYYRTYPNDRWFLKLWVAAVVTLEVFSVICTMHGSYYYLVAHYADPTVLLAKAPWSMVSTGLTSPLAMLLVEFFFVRRLWIIGPRYRVIAVLGAIFNVAAISCGIAAFAFEVESTNISTLMTTNLTTASISMDIVSDILLTSALIYILHNSRTGFQGTSSVVDLLIRYAMGTGLLICLVNIVFLATDQVFTSNLIPGAVGITETKIYGISFLVALNARRSLLAPDEIEREQSLQLTWRVSPDAVQYTISKEMSGSDVQMAAKSSASATPSVPIELGPLGDLAATRSGYESTAYLEETRGERKGMEDVPPV